MSPKNKELAEQIIDFFKEHDTDLSVWDDLSHIVKDQNRMKSIIDSLAKDFEFIEKSGTYSFRLTKKGWDFTSFKELENELIENEKRKQIEFEKTKADLTLVKKTLKEFPRTKFLSWAGFIIGLCLALLELYKYIT